MVDFHAAALRYLERGWCAMPLTLDDAGYPKKPFVPRWPDLKPSRKIIDSLPWDQAAGLGLVLGAASGNLAVIDIDDVDLSDTLVGMFKGVAPMVVRTARNRSHVYVLESKPSPSTRREVTWDGRHVFIELKSTGTQVAAPPTPGYSVPFPDAEPRRSQIAPLWEYIAYVLQQRCPGRLELLSSDSSTPTANYPRPFPQTVPQEQRNNTLYVEAHRLREAGVHVDEAITYLSWRVQHSYAPGDFSLREVERTIRSAYRKGIIQQDGVTANGRDEFALLV